MMLDVIFIAANGTVFRTGNFLRSRLRTTEARVSR